MKAPADGSFFAARHYTFGGFGQPGLGQLDLIFAQKIKPSILTYQAIDLIMVD